MTFDDWLMQGEPGAQSAEYDEAMEVWCRETFPDMDWNNATHVDNAIKAFEAHLTGTTVLTPEQALGHSVTRAQIAESSQAERAMESVISRAQGAMYLPEPKVDDIGPMRDEADFVVPDHKSPRTLKRCIAVGEVTGNGRCALGCMDTVPYVSIQYLPKDAEPLGPIAFVSPSAWASNEPDAPHGAGMGN